MWHKLITAEYFVCPSIADNTDDWWQDAPDDDLEVWNYYMANPHPAKMLREYRIGQARGPSTRSTYSIRPYMYPWGPSQMALNEGAKALIADNFPVPECVLERHRDSVNVAYLDGSVRYVTARILWDNEMSWSFVPKLPTVMEVWRTLDQGY